MKTETYHEQETKGHTPTPWESEWSRLDGNWQLRGKTGSFGSFQGWASDGVTTEAEDDANAALICRCVNAHEALVAALEVLVDRYNDLVLSGDCGSWDPETDQQIIQARAALALANGKGGAA